MGINIRMRVLFRFLIKVEWAESNRYVVRGGSPPTARLIKFTNELRWKHAQDTFAADCTVETRAVIKLIRRYLTDL